MSAVKFQTAFENVTAGADRLGGAIKCEGMRYVSAHFVWSGGATPVGNGLIQVANTKDEPATADWVDSTATAAIAGASGAVAVELSPMAFRWMRAKYDRTSGDATALACFVQGKE